MKLKDKVLQVGASLYKKFMGAYFRSGFKGYLKLAITVLLAAWAVHTYLRNKGLLKKKSVKGQHIFITGAGNGIGKQIALRFARLGAKVSLTDINFESVQKLETEMKSVGLKGKAIYCDVSNLESVKECAEISRKTYGAVDILINNAGIVSGKKLLDNNEKLIEKTLHVNTISHHYTVREFLPAMLKKDKGHIVTIASCAGLVGVCGLVDYCASKFGAVGFDESLRMELRKLKSNVKTTCICPYYINTGMFDGVKTRFPLLLPIMTEKYASDRIVAGILQEEAIVIMPWFSTLTLLARALLPVSWFDKSMELLGVSDSMDNFKGRALPADTNTDRKA